MADHWLGKLLDKLDQHDMWDATVVVLPTDPGRTRLLLIDQMENVPA